MYLKRQRGTNEFVCISESHLQGQFIHMSFGSEVVVTGFNKYHGILGKERETYRDDSACWERRLQTARRCTLCLHQITEIITIAMNSRAISILPEGPHNAHLLVTVHRRHHHHNHSARHRQTACRL